MDDGPWQQQQGVRTLTLRIPEALPSGLVFDKENELSANMPLHPHLLRHSYALELLESSNDVRLVAQALGHSDVRITMRYTERKDEEIAQALEHSRRQRK